MNIMTPFCVSQKVIELCHPLSWYQALLKDFSLFSFRTAAHSQQEMPREKITSMFERI